MALVANAASNQRGVSMPSRKLVTTVAVLIGTAALLAPIWISLELARMQSIANVEARTRGYARNVMHRVNETKVQVIASYRAIGHDHLPLCSEQEVNLMRKLDLSSSYLQGVGRLSGTQLTCTSLGTTYSLDLGPPNVITDDKNQEWISVRIPPAVNHPLTVIGRNGIALILDPSLAVDTVTEGPDVDLAVYPPSSPNHPFLASQGENFHANWFRPIRKGTTVSFIDEGYAVTLIRSLDTDTAVIAAMPLRYSGQGLRRFVLIFVPIGLVCGLTLAAAVLYISRIQLSLPAMLKAAARRGEFFVEYQPQVELETGHWTGAEALVRWNQRGKIVAPDQFIPIAESSGVITLITECVMEKVTSDLPKMLKIDPAFRVAINLSAADFLSGRTVEMLKNLLETSGAGPENIEIEATERGFLQGTKAQEMIAALREMGVTVAVDDFGTGYSSLSCLQTLEVDALKIDKSFVDTIGTDAATSQVVPHIIEMAHSMMLEMVAEGVETEAQAEFLISKGVRYAQGWLFARPMRVEALCAALELRKTTAPEQMRV
jgi:sensor c-di-GMP phosphodiesterase-like protein